MRTYKPKPRTPQVKTCYCGRVAVKKISSGYVCAHCDSLPTVEEYVRSQYKKE